MDVVESKVLEVYLRIGWTCPSCGYAVTEFTNREHYFGKFRTTACPDCEHLVTVEAVDECTQSNDQ